ncbi:uncharacterized protein ColSpa_11854 [Colletotrichum spaethianum]|uniref:Uncharacterized protein n=1 Tax=Colletotrichum spaethianum TaxID=700344 RepID=A0AA37UKQ9_9PEZI|nr:uncharacterized protein ColSpa_11854 [Colletotrichum spaethianum]GKT51674.1 hypothetical protein ColSpa_11854 [Colletotrichum spaethianum]
MLAGIFEIIQTECRQHINIKIYENNVLAKADMLATSAIKWMRQFRTSGGSSVPDAWVLKKPMLGKEDRKA